MEKNKVLEWIKYLASQNSITKEELITSYEAGLGLKKDATASRHLSVSEVLYFIGGLIVFLGISILIYQHWSELNFFTRILATLGSAITAYIVGILFSKYEKLAMVGQAFYLISALVMPIGLYVLFDNLGFKIGDNATLSLISGILTVIYLGSFFIFRKIIFLIFGIGFSTWLFFSFTSFLIGSNPIATTFKLNEYRVLLTGITYMLLGYFFSNREEKGLSGRLYELGVFGFLGAAMALGGWKPNQNMIWELLFPGLVFGVIFLSVKLKAPGFLSFATLFLMAYILKITSEYFADSLGWPLTLVISGLLLIVTGFISLRIHNQYLGRKTS